MQNQIQKIVLEQPVLVRVEEIPSLVNLVNEVCDFYGLKEKSELVPIYENYPTIMVQIVGWVINKVVNENYELAEMKGEKIDPSLGVYRFLPSNMVSSEDKEMPLIFWEGYYFLTAKNDKNEKLVLYLNLTEKGRSSLPCLMLWVPKSKVEDARRFVMLIEKEIEIMEKQSFSGQGHFLRIDRFYTWDDIILPEDRLRMVHTNVIKFLENAKFFHGKGISYKRGIIFYGPPGNGKTLLGKVLACQGKANFVWVTPKHLEHGWSWAVSLGDIYDFARKISPCIVFLEDLDLVGGEERNFRSSSSILCELLNQLDGFEVNNGIITIATTNKIQVLDQALASRPGRFDISVEFPNPNSEMRKRLLEKCCKDFILTENIEINQLADSTEGLSCAYVTEIVKRAVIHSQEENSEMQDEKIVLRKEHFEKALNVYGRGVTKKQVGFVFQ